MTMSSTLDGTTGRRRLDAAARSAERRADAFRGLPPETSRWRVAIALRNAAQPLGLTATMLRLLEHYIDLTHDVDWTAESEPIVTRPLVEIAEHLGRSERQIRNIERRLMELGLLAWRDSGNHHRKGRRNRETGRLVYAYGPSLAPLAVRLDELIALGAAFRRELAERRRLRLAVGARRRRIHALLAEGATLDEPDLRLLERRPGPGCDRRALEAHLEALASLADTLERAHRDALPRAVSGKAEIDHAQETKTPQDSSGDAARGQHDATLRPADAARAAGAAIRGLLPESEACRWSDIVAAASTASRWIGVSERAWDDACATLGRERTAICLLMTEQRLAHGVRKPPAYFAELVRRGATGRLDLRPLMRAAHAPVG